MGGGSRLGVLRRLGRRVMRMRREEGWMLGRGARRPGRACLGARFSCIRWWVYDEHAVEGIEKERRRRRGEEERDVWTLTTTISTTKNIPG